MILKPAREQSMADEAQAARLRKWKIIILVIVATVALIGHLITGN